MIETIIAQSKSKHMAYKVSVKALVSLSTNQTLQVRWKSSIGNSFSVSNGVKHGEVLSPVLFAVYIDGLLTKLKNSGVGCYMGNKFMGGGSFADDIKLSTPTHKGVNKLIYICEQYAAEFDIKFNGAKSKHMAYKGRKCVIHHKDVFVNGEKVECVVTADHLICHRLSTIHKSSMITAAESSFWKSFNLFMANFSHSYSIVKNKFFNQYCCYLYSAPLCLMILKK